MFFVLLMTSQTHERLLGVSLRFEGCIEKGVIYLGLVIPELIIDLVIY